MGPVFSSFRSPLLPPIYLDDTASSSLLYDVLGAKYHLLRGWRPCLCFRHGLLSGDAVKSKSKVARDVQSLWRDQRKGRKRTQNVGNPNTYSTTLFSLSLQRSTTLRPCQCPYLRGAQKKKKVNHTLLLRSQTGGREGLLKSSKTKLGIKNK